MEKLCILLSTYNGSYYIQEQLDSICHQDFDGEVVIYIRDDGSSDNTVDIVKSFSSLGKGNKRIILTEGENIGVHRSFLAILNEAPQADYYAFCDQDDYWYHNKINTAVEYLKREDGPALFYSGYEVVDSLLNKICEEPIKYDAHRSVTQIIFQNKVPGCVMVFNKALLDRVWAVKDIDSVIMHDAYIMCIAFLTGTITSSFLPLIKYRQHGSNALGYGSKKMGVKKWLSHKYSLIRHGDGYDVSRMAGKLLIAFSDVITDKQRDELKIIQNYKYNLKSKFKLLLNRDIYSDTHRSSSLSMFCRILLNII